MRLCRGSLSPPSGLCDFRGVLSHGLRRGLHFFAALRLGVFRAGAVTKLTADSSGLGGDRSELQALGAGGGVWLFLVPTSTSGAEAWCLDGLTARVKLKIIYLTPIVFPAYRVRMKGRQKKQTTAPKKEWE